MGFTTNLLTKKTKTVKYPDLAVLTQHAYAAGDKKTNTKLELNDLAMTLMGYTLNTPNVNTITWGVDSATGNLMLANVEGVDKLKQAVITADNSFSNQKAMERLIAQTGADVAVVNEFLLDIREEDGLMVLRIDGLILNVDDLESGDVAFSEITDDNNQEIVPTPTIEDTPEAPAPDQDVKTTDTNDNTYSKF